MPTPRERRLSHKDTIWARFEGDVPPERSRRMSRVRGKDTKPEIALRRAVHACGARFRVHAKGLPGTPDLANRRAKVVVFVDGCFWHGCPRHFRLPKTRTAFWKEKIRRNMDKRSDVLGRYPDDWQVIQLYECDLKEDLDGWARRVARAMRS